MAEKPPKGLRAEYRRNMPAVGGEKFPKGGKVRSVPMLDQVAVVLDALSRREPKSDEADGLAAVVAAQRSGETGEKAPLQLVAA